MKKMEWSAEMIGMKVWSDGGDRETLMMMLIN